jgi:FKBP-type peptidyl-prolyl cis-trans isomerase
MAKKTQRVFAMVAAILFLLTSVGFTGVVIWQMSQGDKELNDAQPEATQQSGGLAGTQLASFTPVTDVTELQKVDLVEGSGAVVPEGATITANYTGAVAATGKIFESSYDSGQPVSFSLNEVIPGWTQGVPGMKVGGKRRLIIPAELAYGAQSPSPDIPANSALVFDIELVSIN